MDISADLRSLFTWNTKQVFAFVTAEYETSKNVLNQDIHYMVRDEIKSACEYRPFEKCDYSARLSSEISHQKLECVIALVDKMDTIDQYQVSVSE